MRSLLHNYSESKWDRLKRVVPSKTIAAATATIALTACGPNSQEVGSIGDQDSEGNAKPAAASTQNPENNNLSDNTSEISGLNSEVITDAESLGNATYDAFNEWQNSGITEEVAKSSERYDYTDEEYAKIKSAETDAEYIDALFVDDWTKNPQLVDFIETTSEVHATNSQFRLITFSGYEEDKEPYKRLMEPTVINSELETPDKKIVSVSWEGRDNQNMNTAGDHLTGVDPNTETGGSTLTYVLVGKNWKIADVEKYTE